MKLIDLIIYLTVIEIFNHSLSRIKRLHNKRKLNNLIDIINYGEINRSLKCSFNYFSKKLTESQNKL